ncbi:MAG: CRISPR system precrRNA processing endoribonuclease RAMP protein Cas6 [Crenarchaeota archaeon]|nr:CRISPR system precrRNA processing endoribonuclease RAMP protein Cas6 [Thermoproteota archaeon]
MRRHARFRVYLRTDGSEIDEYSGLLAEEIVRKLSILPEHVSPIFDESGKAVYPKVLVRCSFCKDEKPKKRKFARLPYKAYLEFSVEREKLPHITFNEIEVEVREIKINFFIDGIEELDIDVGAGKKLIIKFNGPTLLRDPLRSNTPFTTRFLPLPSFLFSSYTDDKNVLRKLNETFVEDHSILHSTGKVWYLYKGRWLPGLSGTALFHVVEEPDEVVLEILEKAAINGIGFERDKGFGDVKLELF